jgi:hypothetical protein
LLLKTELSDQAAALSRTSIGPVIWTCIGLSALATLASARLIRPQPAVKAPG